MELFGVLLGAVVVGNMVKLDIYDEASGKRKIIKCNRGKYSRRDFTDYHAKPVELGFNVGWGNNESWKLVRVSLRAPVNTIWQ